MSYDLEIFNGNPEEPEDTFAQLDCRLAWRTLEELLAKEKILTDQDELIWFLPTRTVSIYLGTEDEKVRSMAAALVWGDRSVDSSDAMTMPPVGENDAEMRADLTRIFIVLHSLATKLGAALYDTQHGIFVERAKISQFVEEFNHDDMVRRVASGETGAEAVPLRTTDEGQKLTPKKLIQFKPITVLAVLLVLGLLGMKVMNRTERIEARHGVTGERSAVTAPARTQQPQRTGTPRAELWLAENNVINRSALQHAEGVRNLTWVIQSNGQTVLERNAQNETQYSLNRFTKGSVVTVYLKAWFDGGYHTVSNVVTFQAQ